MIIHEGYNRVIYIHIPRCAGRHVTAYFKKHHITESDYDTFIDEQNFNSAFRMYMKARTLSDNEEFLYLVDQRILNTIQLNILPTTISELSTISTNPNERIIYELAKAFNDISSGNPDAVAYNCPSVNE